MINYFEFYEIKPSLEPNLSKLKLKYYAYARKFHPDHNEGRDAEQMAAINNEAYECLRNLDCRLNHVLNILGSEEASPKVSDPMFLMEMMELQEKIEGANAEDLSDCLRDIDNFEISITNDLEKISLVELDSNFPIEQLQNIIAKRRYLSRLRESIDLSMSN